VVKNVVFWQVAQEIKCNLDLFKQRKFKEIFSENHKCAYVILIGI
jgi:hypothetical protein